MLALLAHEHGVVAVPEAPEDQPLLDSMSSSGFSSASAVSPKVPQLATRTAWPLLSADLRLRTCTREMIG